MKKRPNQNGRLHNQQKAMLEMKAAQQLLSYLARHDHGQRYLLGPHREAPDFTLRVLAGPFTWRFLGLEVTHLYASDLDAAQINGSLRPPRDRDDPAPVEERLQRLDRAIHDKNDKFANYEIKPCWLLIHNADHQIHHDDWLRYLAGKEYSDSPYEKIWLISGQQQIINIK